MIRCVDVELPSFKCKTLRTSHFHNAKCLKTFSVINKMNLSCCDVFLWLFFLSVSAQVQNKYISLLL